MEEEEEEGDLPEETVMYGDESGDETSQESDAHDEEMASDDHTEDRVMSPSIADEDQESPMPPNVMLDSARDLPTSDLRRQLTAQHSPEAYRNLVMATDKLTQATHETRDRFRDLIKDKEGKSLRN